MGPFARVLGIARAMLLSCASFLSVPIAADACLLVNGRFYFTGTSVGLRVDEVRNYEKGRLGFTEARAVGVFGARHARTFALAQARRIQHGSVTGSSIRQEH